MGSNGAKSTYMKPAGGTEEKGNIGAVDQDWSVPPKSSHGATDTVVSAEREYCTSELEPGLGQAETDDIVSHSFGPGPPVARIAAYMSTRVASDIDPNWSTIRAGTLDNKTNKKRNSVITEKETAKEIPNDDQAFATSEVHDEPTGVKSVVETTDASSSGIHDSDDNTRNTNMDVDVERENTTETMSEVPPLRLTVSELVDHVTPRIEETDDVASAFEKHARIAQRSRTETYRKQTPVPQPNEGHQVSRIPHDSTIMSGMDEPYAHDNDQSLHKDEQQQNHGKNSGTQKDKVSEEIGVKRLKSHTKIPIASTDKHAKCKDTQWRIPGDLNSVFSNPWQAVRKEANVNRNNDPGQRYKTARQRRRESESANIKDSETQTSIDFSIVKPQHSSDGKTIEDVKQKLSDDLESSQRSEMRASGDVSVRQSSPDENENTIEIQTGTVQMASTSGRESALQLRSEVDNGRSKQLLELMSKGLGNFTDQMAEVMITKIRPEYEVLARQVGEEVKENTMVELKDLRVKVKRARTTLDDLEKDKETLKRELTNEREHLKKKLEKDKAKRTKDNEEKNDRIKDLTSQREKLQNSMKEYERMYKRAEHKAKHEEKKRVKTDEQYKKHLNDLKKQLDKVKGDLLVQKSLRRLTAIANERKAHSASNLSRLVSHHGAEHKPVD